MAAELPTQFELKCGGCSMMIAALLWVVGFWLFQVDHDLWNTATDEQVTILHDKLSSNEYRSKIEIACVLIWISFPLVLAAINAYTKLSLTIFQKTPGISPSSPMFLSPLQFSTNYMFTYNQYKNS